MALGKDMFTKHTTLSRWECFDFMMQREVWEQRFLTFYRGNIPRLSRRILQAQYSVLQYELAGYAFEEQWRDLLTQELQYL